MGVNSPNKLGICGSLLGQQFGECFLRDEQGFFHLFSREGHLQDAFNYSWGLEENDFDHRDKREDVETNNGRYLETTSRCKATHRKLGHRKYFLRLVRVAGIR